MPLWALNILVRPEPPTGRMVVDNLSYKAVLMYSLRHIGSALSIKCLPDLLKMIAGVILGGRGQLLQARVPSPGSRLLISSFAEIAADRLRISRVGQIHVDRPLLHKAAGHVCHGKSNGLVRRRLLFPSRLGRRISDRIGRGGGGGASCPLRNNATEIGLGVDLRAVVRVAIPD